MKPYKENYRRTPFLSGIDMIPARLFSKKTVIASAILAIALLLRLYGIWHGYPYSFYPDEAHFVKRALSFGSMDFNPHWFHKPAFYMYILFFEYGIFFVFGKIIGLWSSVADFAVSYILNPGPFYVIGRITTTLFGLASIWVVYLTGEKFFKKNTGLVAALLLTLSFAHVVSCQDVKADIPASFFAILSMYLLLNYSISKNTKWLICSAIIAGIGAGTKVYPIVMLVPITLATVICTYDRKASGYSALRIVSLAVLAIAVFWLSYFCSSPYSFIDPRGRVEVFEDFIRLFSKIFNLFSGRNIVPPRPDDFIAQRADVYHSIIHYFRIIFQTRGMGPIIASFSLFGLALFWANRTYQFFLFIMFPVIFIFISFFTFPGYAEPRHQMPIYPFLALTGAVFVIHLAGQTSLRKNITFISLAALLLLPLFRIVQRGYYISKTDTRNLAKTWIENNIPSQSKILINENGPQLLQSKTKILQELDEAKKADSSGQFTAHYGIYLTYQLLAADKTTSYLLSEIRLPWWRNSDLSQGLHEMNSKYDQDMANPLKPVGVNDYQYYIGNNYEYAVVHSDEYQLFLKKDSKMAVNFPSFAKFYTELFNAGELIKEFSPTDGNRPGPTVKIYRFR